MGSGHRTRPTDATLATPPPRYRGNENIVAKALEHEMGRGHPMGHADPRRAEFPRLDRNGNSSRPPLNAWGGSPIRPRNHPCHWIGHASAPPRSSPILAGSCRTSWRRGWPPLRPARERGRRNHKRFSSTGGPLRPPAPRIPVHAAFVPSPLYRVAPESHAQSRH